MLMPKANKTREQHYIYIDMIALMLQSSLHVNGVNVVSSVSRVESVSSENSL